MKFWVYSLKIARSNAGEIEGVRRRDEEDDREADDGEPAG